MEKNKIFFVNFFTIAILYFLINYKKLQLKQNIILFIILR